jgi:hypothetical protein
MKLWLDDCRIPPDVMWLWCKTAGQAWRLLAEAPLDAWTAVSLDHDLGFRRASAPREPTGADLVKWMKQFDIWPTKCKPTVHSANAEGARVMRAMIDAHYDG